MGEKESRAAVPMVQGHPPAETGLAGGKLSAESAVAEARYRQREPMNPIPKKPPAVRFPAPLAEVIKELIGAPVKAPFPKRFLYGLTALDLAGDDELFADIESLGHIKGKMAWNDPKWPPWCSG
jgi:hypothetical protein